MAKDAVLAEMRRAKAHDVRYKEGRAFSLVYEAGEEVLEVLKAASLMFFSENGLNPTAFPSLRRFESEVVAMAADLLGGDEGTVGNMTSGGTESCLLAVKAAREAGRAQRPWLDAPEMVLPISAHPAFDKAAHYFGLRAVRTPLLEDWSADVEAMEAAITPRTVLLVASAPSYPHGVMDPIPQVAEVARRHGLPLHVDACVGGFMLPFVRKLGYPVPDFDFRVPGVTSISADLHKYGYAAKGASLLLYRDRSLRRHQLFVTTDWPGGIYASATISGTRPAGPIAAAWAVMKFLGEEGYLRIARQVMEATQKIRQGIGLISGVEVLGDPVMSVLALASPQVDIYEVGDELGLRGWTLDRQQYPPSLHMTVNFLHVGHEDQFISDLAAAVAAARRARGRSLGRALAIAAVRTAARLLPERWMSALTGRAAALLGIRGGGLPRRSAAIYGMMASLPNRGDLRELVLDLVESFTAVAPMEEGEA
jgi:glutamate/tyrosine decarboxylase-like PLP-dependent enzyme